MKNRTEGWKLSNPTAEKEKENLYIHAFIKGYRYACYSGAVDADSYEINTARSSYKTEKDKVLDYDAIEKAYPLAKSKNKPVEAGEPIVSNVGREDYWINVKIAIKKKKMLNIECLGGGGKYL